MVKKTQINGKTILWIGRFNAVTIFKWMYRLNAMQIKIPKASWEICQIDAKI